jgi:hypothetical protein
MEGVIRRKLTMLAVEGIKFGMATMRVMKMGIMTLKVIKLGTVKTGRPIGETG